MARNPRNEPAAGDVIEFQISPSSRLWGHFRVTEVKDAMVFYWDEGLIDHVPIDRWRQWFVNRRNVRVTPAQ
jgi:hypothetical protein